MSISPAPISPSTLAEMLALRAAADPDRRAFVYVEDASGIELTDLWRTGSLRACHRREARNGVEAKGRKRARGMARALDGGEKYATHGFFREARRPTANPRLASASDGSNRRSPGSTRAPWARPHLSR